MVENDIHYGDGFLRDVRKLPKGSKIKLSKLTTLLKTNVFDSRLHTKPLGSPLEGIYSFRITRDWRVGFYFISQNTIKLLIVDHRDSIYERLKRILGR